jgi:DNA-binding NarL/FixJ family response regulator
MSGSTGNIFPRKSSEVFMDDRQTRVRRLRFNRLEWLPIPIFLLAILILWIDLASQLLPDVILMDISMPVLNGIEATCIIRNEFPDIHIIGLSMFEEAERAQAMRDAGAADYIMKSGPIDELVSAIRKAVNRLPKSNAAAT